MNEQEQLDTFAAQSAWLRRETEALKAAMFRLPRREYRERARELLARHTQHRREFAAFEHLHGGFPKL